MGSAAVSFSNLPSHASKPSTKRLHQPHPDSGCRLSFTLVASTRYACASGMKDGAVRLCVGWHCQFGALAVDKDIFSLNKRRNIKRLLQDNAAWPIHCSAFDRAGKRLIIAMWPVSTPKAPQSTANTTSRIAFDNVGRGGHRQQFRLNNLLPACRSKRVHGCHSLRDFCRTRGRFWRAAPRLRHTL